MLPLEGCPPLASAPSVAGRLLERSQGKDTTVGHWELAGIVTERPFPTYPHGFPQDVLDAFAEATGRGVIGNVAASGTEIIERLGEEHQRTGKWIVYTSADSVFQIAAHEADGAARGALRGLPHRARRCSRASTPSGRVIARPFEGEPGAYRRTANRHDFSLEPPRPNYLSRIREAGARVTGVGKIGDVFAGCDIDDSQPTHSNAEGLARTIALARERRRRARVREPRRDRHDLRAPQRSRGLPPLPAGDRRGASPTCSPRSARTTCCVLTSDHGCDPTTPSTDHSREYALLVAHVPGRAPAGRHDGEFADVGRDRGGVARRARRATACRAPRSTPVRAVELIERKRDGAEHAPGEITWLVEGFVAGRVAPEQMSAWAMAVVFRGLSDAETHELTQAMVDSGATIDLSSLGRTVVDKHSTGGVGDKTTIALAPLAAAMGMPVAKLSGPRPRAHRRHARQARGDPGLPRRAERRGADRRRSARIGCALAAQTDDLVPADRLLYALRDVTGTVPGARPDRRVGDVQEARRGRRRDPARRQGGGGRVHARPRLGARAGRAHARHRRARRPARRSAS